MNWLNRAAVADSLPAVWLIATGRAPRTIDERSALRRSVAREVLGRQFGQPVAIAHDDAGRPQLAGLPELHISLATRGGVVALALAQNPVGVDIEALTQAPFPTSMLHEAERAAIDALPAAARPLGFTRIWAAKEAYVKALGTGFLRPPDSFCVRLEGERFRIDDGQRPTTAQGWLRTMKNGGQEDLAAAVFIFTE